MKNLQITFLQDENGQRTNAPDQGKCKALKDVRIGSRYCRDCKYSTLDKFDLRTLFTAPGCECTHEKNRVADTQPKTYRFETESDNFTLVTADNETQALETFIADGYTHCFGMYELDDKYNEVRAIDWRDVLNAMPHETYQNIGRETTNNNNQQTTQKTKAMKNEKINAQDNTNEIDETQNVATETTNGNDETQNVATETTNGNTGTPEQEKASRILKARLPKLAEAGLNFEKRSGSFFRASLVKETDENGETVEKVRRIVVDLTHESEAETVANCTEEMNAKRAAALVLDGEKRRAKLESEKEAAEKTLAESVAALETFDADMSAAIETVNATELPERAVREPRLAVTAKLESAQSEIEKLRALLIASGINPETGEPAQ